MCFGGSSEPCSLARLRRGLEGGVDGVRFRRGRQVDAGLRKRQFALGRAEIVVGVLGGIGDHQRLRIGKADVLHRHAHQPPAEIERVLAGVEHAREIIERRVRIGAAHRFVQRRDQIVVAVLALVVDRRAPLDDASAALRRRTPRRALPRARPPRRASALRGRRRRPCAISTARAVLVERQRLRLRSPRRAPAAFRGCPRQACGRPARARATASAALSSKDGFSVVAPTRTIVPSSMTGRKLSCCARLKRWISSTNSSVCRPLERRSRAVSNTFFRSATPEKIAEICSKASPVSPASSRATVVLPVPGGPQKIIEPSEPERIIRVSAPSAPVRCSWPTTSARFFGRSRSASGAAGCVALSPSSSGAEKARRRSSVPEHLAQQLAHRARR